MANEFVARKGLISLQTSSFLEDVNISGSVYIGTAATSSHLTVSGSQYISKTLTVDGGITGSLYGTSSWAISSSLSVNASTASYINPLVQDVYITGSLNVSGSTLQVGNNTLLGNTSLSGSLTISGAFGSPTPSISIFGDVAQTGYIRFNSVTTNIDNSISASYIYVSGSTNDLYFTQNTQGYNNTTRLRWIEGNLYTGLLHGGFITTQSANVYQISSGSGIIVNLNASLSDDPYPTIQYLEWPNISASIDSTSASYDQTYVSINSSGQIYAQGTPLINGQYDDLISIGIVLHSNRSTISGTKTYPSVAYGNVQRQMLFTRAFGPLKLSGLTLAVSGSSTGSLIVTSGTAFTDGANYPIDPNDPSYIVDSGTTVSKIWRYYQSGSGWVYDTNSGAGYGAIDPTQYSNNGVLSNVLQNEYTIQRVYWFTNSVSKAIVVYYGNKTYSSLGDAIANINIESFVEAPNTAANAVYLGAICIRGGINTSLQNPAHFTILPGGLFRSVGGSGGGGSTVTQTLSGLSDVNISGPTDGQALVYNSTALRWQNSSNISASITGNAATATSASHAEHAKTSSYSLNAESLLSGININVNEITASSILVTNLYVQNITSSTELITGSLTVSGSLIALGGITGSLYGTSSWAVSASWSPIAVSASYVVGAVSASYIDFAQTADLPASTGRLQWESDFGTLEFTLRGGTVTFPLGFEELSYVYNYEATTLNKGEVVYVSGSNNDRIGVKRASAAGDPTSARTLGLVSSAIPAGGSGYVTTRGILRDVDTSMYNAGDTLYVSSSAGQLTNVKPQAPIHMVYAGFVTRVGVGNGIIFVMVQNGYELDEIHDVRILNKSTGDLLVQSSSGLWVNSKTLPGDYTISGSLAMTGSISLSGSLNYNFPNNKDFDLITWPSYYGGLGKLRKVFNGIQFYISQGGGSTFEFASGDMNFDMVLTTTGYFQVGRQTNSPRLYGPDVGGRLELRNSAYSQSFAIYNTYSSDTNYERLGLNWRGNVAQIYTETGSAGGSIRSLVLGTNSKTALTIDTNNNVSASYSLFAPSITGSLLGTSSWAVTSSYSLKAESLLSGVNINVNEITASSILVTNLYVQNITSSTELVTGSLTVSGSLNALGGITGSLLGTASWAVNSITSSYSLTASYIDGGFY